ncbi:endonuclease domain-containing protein [Armatimonas sp.]|uniref:endonuclease domain-containing protein n=1 Tax=Armatimonas sp. TaxID=1872638 RepID=UPI00374CA8CD
MRKNDVKRRCLMHLRDQSRALRNSPTEAERRLWEALRYDRCEGLRFLRQYVIGVYIVDFYCAQARLIIEVDGSIHDLPEVRLKDQSRAALLQEHGLRLLRLTNEQVRTQTPEQLRKRVKDFLATVE